MSKILSRLLVAATAGVALLPLAAPAQAEDVRQVEVRFNDLNLQSSAGQALLHRRLSSATSTVCEETSALATQTCRLESLRRARAELAKKGVPAA
ncbi:UrcA family protein [Sphingomonas morindae]|uniref:UrcA family protein n=1 Tax=Sphingomonas morindae TaxID=1541170 RepID=A0ABY4XB29_9SPHN|nr:UrcA family protein [Sphingomonas morindae]USI74177.1 UrcA family protein [Sphingomonas morindae]